MVTDISITVPGTTKARPTVTDQGAKSAQALIQMTNDLVCGGMRMLSASGFFFPQYLDRARTHSGCFFCFFQQPIEWIRLLENHPEQFEEAMNYEKISDEAGKTFTWNQGMPLSEFKKPEVQEAILRRYEERKVL